MADTCPKCGRTGIDADKCPGCGVIIPLYERYLEKVRQGPARPGPIATESVTALPTPGAPAVERASASPSGTVVRAPFFRGTGLGLWGVQVVGLFLTIVTFGIFYPWAKTRIRYYLFSQTEFEGDRLEYHGTGRELFIGTVKAFLIFGAPVSILNWIAQAAGGGVISLLVNALVIGLTAVFIPLATVGARRYRLSRTSWRGIRFSFRGEAKTFIKSFLGWLALSVVTAGIYYPILVAKRHAFLTAHSYFGNARFGFDGAPNALSRPFLRVWLVGLGTVVATFACQLAMPPVSPLVFLGGLVAVGLTWVSFLAAKRRFFWNHTTIANARFRSTVTTSALLNLWIVNVLLLGLTLGLAAPWVRVRNIRFTFDRLRLVGDIDPAAIVQDARSAPATGEALSGLLDADIEIGG